MLLYAGIAGILLGRFFAGLACVGLFFPAYRAPRLFPFLSFSLTLHLLFSTFIRALGNLAWQALAANISKCDLVLIPSLCLLNLNNGDCANLLSVAVNLQAYWNSIARLRIFCKSPLKSILLGNLLSFYKFDL